MPFLKEYGHRLIDNGYAIVPIKKGFKAPMIKGWQAIDADHELVDQWVSNGHRDGGVGILCKSTAACDIDCYDKEVNKKLLVWLRENVGDTGRRVGQAPKFVMPYRVSSPIKKIRSAEFSDDLGTKHAVEVLGEGQQFVAFGVHPATKEPYRWFGNSLADVNWQDLPEITKEKAEAFVAYFEKVAGENGWELVRTGVSGSDIDLDGIAHLKPKHDITDDELRDRLECVDPDITHDEWVTVGMALHHQYDGGDEGCAIWDEWSQAGGKYKEGECERRYQTFDSTSRTPKTVASILSMSKESVTEKVVEEKFPQMLNRWAFVHVEGSARVIREDLNKDNIVLYKLEDLKKEHMNCRVLGGTEDKPKLINLVDTWLESPERRTYPAGLTFAPEVDMLNKYNLWRGWSYSAVEGDVSPWLGFVTDVIADGNEIYANYIIAWAAQMVQQPMNKVGVGLVLRGRKGTGKTKFGELLGGLVKAHHQIVSRAEHVTGNFNRHLEDTLLLQADEAYWAGAKSSEGALKDLLTNPEITIERKGVDAYTAPNYTRVLFTSNDDFVVPASLDERRFAVFDVGQSQQQNSSYFSSLDRWYKSGGASHLLHYLKNYDLSNVDIRIVPQTDALQDQKLETLDTVTMWLLNCLQSAELRESRVAGVTVHFGEQASKSEIYDIYVSSLRNSKFENPVKSNKFWKEIKKYPTMFTLGKYKRVGESRYQMMQVGDLEASRFEFDSVNSLGVAWPEILDLKVEDDDWGDHE